MEPSYTDSRYINVSHKHGSRGYHMALLFSCFELSLLKGKEEKQQLCCSGKGPSFPTMLWGPSSHRLAGLGNSVTLTPDFHSVISELLKLVFYPLFQCLLTQESGKWERKGKEDRHRSPALPAWKQWLTLITPLRPVFEQTYFLYELMQSDLLFYILFIIWAVILSILRLFCYKGMEKSNTIKLFSLKIIKPHNKI